MKKIIMSFFVVFVGNIGFLKASDVEPFFADEKTQITVNRYFKDGDAVKARVKGIRGEESKIAIFPVVGSLWESRWQYDDANLTATLAMMGNIEVGREDFVSLPGVYQKINVSYELLKETEEQEGKLVANGDPLTVHSLKIWQRPDNSIYKQTGEALYRLRLEETREPIEGVYSVLMSSKKDIKFRGLKSRAATRYYINDYKQEQVELKITKLAVDSDDVMGDPKVEQFVGLSLLESRNGWDNNSVCSIANLPENYQIGK